jgi:thermitase
MKALKFLVPVLVAISLVGVSWGLAGATLAGNSGHDIAHTHLTVATGVEVPISSAAVLDQPSIESALVTDSSLSDSAPAIEPQLPISNDPYLENQWALSQIQLVDLWQVTTGSPEIVVAVLDTGIDQNHEDLEGKVVAEVNFTDSPTPSDAYGHGTHIAGIIAANSNNGIGIAGLAPECRLMNVKVANDKGRCQASAVAEGIIWAVDNGASVINLSVELGEPSSELEKAVDYAWSHGAIIIAAAGNDGSELPVYPAYYEDCIAVAGTKQDGTLAPLSNHGDWVDAAAPGFNIYSTLPQNSYGYKTGTSFATAYVSGLAALLFNVVSDSNGDGKLNDEVRVAIEAGCQQIGIDGVGTGRIDAATSLAEIGYTP